MGLAHVDLKRTSQRPLRSAHRPRYDNQTTTVIKCSAYRPRTHACNLVDRLGHGAALLPAAIRQGNLDNLNSSMLIAVGDMWGSMEDVHFSPAAPFVCFGAVSLLLAAFTLS